MSGLNNLNKRLAYLGGHDEGRMIKDKERTLKRVLWASYQAETAILPDGREFKCLINSDRIKTDFEDRTISIPFKDMCLTSKKLEYTNIKVGDVITWKEDNSDWLVYFRRPEENAYFRAELRKCRYTTKIGECEYKIYLGGPIEIKQVWESKSTREGSSFSWNDLNYHLAMYITKDENTLENIKRFSKIKIDGKTYEVQVADSISIEGLIEVALKEDFTNSYEEEEIIVEKIPEETVYIDGPNKTYPFEIFTFSVINGNGKGAWEIDNLKKAFILNQTAFEVTLKITTSKSGEFNLLYKEKDNEVAKKLVTIESL